jgi:outer membrane protein assembly factor BamB
MAPRSSPSQTATALRAHVARALASALLVVICCSCNSADSPMKPSTTTPGGVPLRSIAWSHPAVNPNAAIVIGDTVVAVKSAGDSIVAISAATGSRVLAIAPTGGPLLSECSNGAVSSRDVVVFVCGDIIALDRRTLGMLWRRSGIPANNRPAIGGPDSATVFFASRSARAAAVEARSGALRWERDVPAASGGGLLRPVVTGDTVIWAVRTTQLPDVGGIVGLDVRSGLERLLVLIPSSLSPINQSAPLDGPARLGTLLITSGFDGQLYATDPSSGGVRWVAPLDSATSGGGQFRYLVTAGELAIATSLAGHLTGYSAANGSRVFTLPIGNRGSILDRPKVVGDRLFVANLGGQLASIRLGMAPTVEWITSGFFPEKILSTVGATSTHVIAGEFSTIQRIVGVRR